MANITRQWNSKPILFEKTLPEGRWSWGAQNVPKRKKRVWRVLSGKDESASLKG